MECEFQYKFIYKMLDIQEEKGIMINDRIILIYDLCLKVDGAEQSQIKSRGLLCKS